MSRPKTLELAGYKLGKELGAGSFGSVRIARDEATGEQVAVKVISKSSISDIADVERVSREFFILTCLDHENVIRLNAVRHDDLHLFLVMEYAGGGSLDEVLRSRKNGRMSESEARELFRRIAAGVRYCHKNRVVHRDLKPENILLSSSGQVKVADFGLSNTVSYGSVVKSPVGTPLFSAPEVLVPHAYNTSDYNGASADVWSMGVILFSLVTGALPFPAKNLRQLRQMVQHHEVEYPPYVSRACTELIQLMLHREPEKRPTADEVFHHAWVQEGRGSLPHMLSELSAASPRSPSVPVTGFKSLSSSGSLGSDEGRFRKFSEPSGTCGLDHSLTLSSLSNSHQLPDTTLIDLEADISKASERAGDTTRGVTSRSRSATCVPPSSAMGFVAPTATHSPMLPPAAFLVDNGALEPGPSPHRRSSSTTEVDASGLAEDRTSARTPPISAACGDECSPSSPSLTASPSLASSREVAGDLFGAKPNRRRRSSIRRGLVAKMRLRAAGASTLSPSSPDFGASDAGDGMVGGGGSQSAPTSPTGGMERRPAGLGRPRMRRQLSGKIGSRPRTSGGALHAGSGAPATTKAAEPPTIVSTQIVSIADIGGESELHLLAQAHEHGMKRAPSRGSSRQRRSSLPELNSIARETKGTTESPDRQRSNTPNFSHRVSLDETKSPASIQSDGGGEATPGRKRRGRLPLSSTLLLERMYVMQQKHQHLLHPTPIKGSSARGKQTGSPGERTPENGWADRLYKQGLRHQRSGHRPSSTAGHGSHLMDAAASGLSCSPSSPKLPPATPTREHATGSKDHRGDEYVPSPLTSTARAILPTMSPGSCLAAPTTGGGGGGLGPSDRPSEDNVSAGTPAASAGGASLLASGAQTFRKVLSPRNGDKLARNPPPSTKSSPGNLGLVQAPHGRARHDHMHIHADHSADGSPGTRIERL